MAWCHSGEKPLPDPMLTYCQFDSEEQYCKQTSVKIESKQKNSLSRKCIWKCCLQSGSHFPRTNISTAALYAHLPWPTRNSHMATHPVLGCAIGNWESHQFAYVFFLLSTLTPISYIIIQDNYLVGQFSAANLALAGFPQTNALGENLPSRYLNMFNLRLCNAATIRCSILNCGHMHLCGKGYKYFSPHCCKCNSFGCIAAIRCGNACHGPHSDSVYSGSEHR